jgi:conjugative relaxase-like TrwC/TraI family protein
MITPATQMSLENARNYFREHLRQGDYYSENEHVSGQWFGEGASLLGLSDTVSEAEFLNLCDGNHPATGERLTARKNTVRKGATGEAEANRRVLYDWVMRPPKSVSIVALVNDARIIAVHDHAVRVALRELEFAAQARVRRAGLSEDRDTGNITAALFRHDTSRDQDPLLHTHCVVFNATHDATEGRWKALQNARMMRMQKLASALYDQELVKGLRGLGYEIQREGVKWEIAGIGRDLVEQFSKRRMSILEAAKEAAKKAGIEVSDFTLRDRIAREERKRKIKDANAAQLRAKWRAELGSEGLSRVVGALGAPKAPLKVDIKAAAQWARDLVFERKVAVRMPEMEAAIMRRALGSEFTREEIREAAIGGDVVRKEGTEILVSMDAWQREAQILGLAKAGRGQYGEIAGRFEVEKTALSDEQKTAVTVMTRSCDFVTLLRGQAGSGKSTTLRVFCEAVIQAKKPLFVATPQGVQAQDLVADGMQATTLAALLRMPVIPHGAIVLVDEAGQLSGKDMSQLLHRVDAVGGRVVLSGDTRQHGAVEASDALRLLEKYAKLPTAELKTVIRQDAGRGRDLAEREKIATYKRAVEVAAAGEAVKSLAILMEGKAVREVGEAERAKLAAAAYVNHRGNGESALVVSQTRSEVAQVNEAIAHAMEARGLVRSAEEVAAYQVRDLLKAEKRLAESYSEGQFVRFNRVYGAIAKNAVLEITHVRNDGLVLREPGSDKLHRVSFDASEQWDAIERRALRVGTGSILQLRSNGLSRNAKAHTNGELVEVLEVWPDIIRVKNRMGKELSLDRAKLVANQGYAVTSYGSQGKTVEHVIMVDSGAEVAANQREFYVSVSRARRSVEIFTINVRDLARRIAADGERELAMDFDLVRRQVRPTLTPRSTTLRRWMWHGARVLARARAVRRRVVNRITQKPRQTHGPVIRS